MSPRLHFWAPLLVVSSLLSACVAASTDDPTPTAAAVDLADLDLPPFLTEVPEGMDPQLLGPLYGLGECDFDPEPVEIGTVEGLYLPPEAIVTKLDENGPLTNIQGFVPYTPIQTRLFFQLQEGIETLQAEDEIREAEVLVGDGQHRLFFKAQAVCDRGSIFVAVVAPEAASGSVPTPAGSPGASPSP